MLQLFVQTPNTIILPIEVEQDAMIKHVFDALDEQWSTDDYYLSFGGNNDFDDDQLLSDAGIGSESTLQLKPWTKEKKILSAFKETNVVEQYHWNTQSDNCCDDWDGIHCDYQNQHVIEITCHKWNININGNVNLSKLPKSLKKIDLINNHLCGNIDLTKLPPTLEQLDLSRNQLIGNVDLTQLPPTLQLIRLYGNKLNGNIDLTKLPQSLRILNLHDNKLNGGIDLKKLPSALTILNLNDNQLNGRIDFTKLPQSLTSLYLTGNQFEGYYGQKTERIHLEYNVPSLDLIQIYLDTEDIIALVIICVFLSFCIYKCIINCKQGKHEEDNDTATMYNCNKLTL